MKVPPQTTKLYVAGFFLLTLALLVFVQAAFNLDPFFSPTEPDQIVLLYTLSTFIFLVLLIFGFVLLRTLIKVWVERKQQKPGSKFKTKLVVSLILLTLIPATCLFLFAFGLVNRSIVKWFSVPVDQIFSASGTMTAEWRRDHEALERSILNYLEQEPLQNLDRIRQTFQLKGTLIISDDGQVLRASSDSDVRENTLAKQIRAALGNKNEAFLDIDSYWIGVRRGTQEEKHEILAIVFPRPARLVELTAKLAEEKYHYQLLVQNQKVFRDTYVIILLLMTVLVLFAAV